MPQIDSTMKAVTVRQLMNLHIFKKYMRLVAGEGGLDRTVVHTTVWEAPDLAAQLEGREFVLSVGYLTSVDPPRALRGFDELTDKVTAMGFKVGRYIKQVPEEYIRIANEKKIPLFEIQSSCLFKWIIQSIMAEINLYQASVLMEVDHYFQELYDTALDDSRDVRVLTQLSNRIHAPCLLLTADLQTPAWSSAFAPQSELNGILEEVRHVIPREHRSEPEWRDGKWHILTLAASGVALGYLIVMNEDELSDTARLMIKQLRMHLTMKWLERYKGRQDTLTRLWKRLMNTPARDERAIRDAMNANGFRAGESFRVIVLRGSGGKPLLNSGGQFLAGSLGRLLKKHLMIWLNAGECVLLADADKEQDEPYYLYAMKEILAAERTALLSVGPVAEGIAAVRDSYRIASNCFSVARAHAGDKVLYYGDWLHELSLLGGAGTLETRLFVEKSLAPVLRYDAEHGNRTLMETLAVAAESDTIAAAADKLHVHANTLRYRIARIKDLTNLDLFAYHDRELLSHACFCHEFALSDEDKN
jgi:purine catabolism regulator